MKICINRIILVCTFAIAMSSCEEEYIPKGNAYEKQIVVESYIEKSPKAFFTYAIVTYSLPFYSNFGVDVINNSFVRDANVSIEVGSKRIQLRDTCLSEIPDSLKTEFTKILGFDLDSVQTDICVYFVSILELIPEEGIEYRIRVIKDNDTLYGTTTIPKLIPIDSVWFEKPAGKNQNDTFAQMFCIISDIPGHKDYYRYFTAGQGERLVANVNSVTDDVFFDGQKFKFTLTEARGPDEEFGDNTGLFRRGDTIQIKWCNLPQTHYDFWNTLETSRTRQGPFSSYVRIDGNIQNGLGIFGGQNCSYYTVVVPK